MRLFLYGMGVSLFVFYKDGDCMRCNVPRFLVASLRKDADVTQQVGLVVGANILRIAIIVLVCSRDHSYYLAKMN